MTNQHHPSTAQQCSVKPLAIVELARQELLDSLPRIASDPDPFRGILRLQEALTNLKRLETEQSLYLHLRCECLLRARVENFLTKNSECPHQEPSTCAQSQEERPQSKFFLEERLDPTPHKSVLALLEGLKDVPKSELEPLLTVAADRELWETFRQKAAEAYDNERTDYWLESRPYYPFSSAPQLGIRCSYPASNPLLTFENMSKIARLVLANS